MRTTLIIPDDLMTEALAITGFQSKTDVVIQCMREYIRSSKRMKFKEAINSFSLDLNVAASRRRPSKRVR